MLMKLLQNLRVERILSKFNIPTVFLVLFTGSDKLLLFLTLTSINIISVMPFLRLVIS